MSGWSTLTKCFQSNRGPTKIWPVLYFISWTFWKYKWQSDKNICTLPGSGIIQSMSHSVNCHHQWPHPVWWLYDSVCHHQASRSSWASNLSDQVTQSKDCWVARLFLSPSASSRSYFHQPHECILASVWWCHHHSPPDQKFSKSPNKSKRFIALQISACGSNHQ